ncbi:Hypothetical predicted protein [Paramuricea clavata]|uniref:Uncharacterized protein n=1 Tax=Paramuricea clavata TaxID=317549 RepID=A0A7D9LSV8_PARCT|nr:Hypothetical predicted protein [Paramuricea clavata]
MSPTKEKSAMPMDKTHSQDVEVKPRKGKGKPREFDSWDEEEFCPGSSVIATTHGSFWKKNTNMPSPSYSRKLSLKSSAEDQEYLTTESSEDERNIEDAVNRSRITRHQETKANIGESSSSQVINHSSLNLVDDT